MLLSHIGFAEKGKNLEMALDICGQYEKKMTITGRLDGATGAVFTDYIMEWLKNPKLKETWEVYLKA
jgi:isocitrate dehydrogenase (NAD+)